MQNAIWNRQAGRGAFVAVSVILIALITVLPGALRRLIHDSMQGNRDLGVVLVFQGYGTEIGLCLLMLPLVLIARQRLNDLRLSGVFLFPFPILPLKSLSLAAIAPASMLGQGIGPAALPDFVIGAFFFVFLAMFPGQRDASEASFPILVWLRKATTCDGRMGVVSYRRFVAAPVIILIALNTLPSMLFYGAHYGIQGSFHNRTGTQISPLSWHDAMSYAYGALALIQTLIGVWLIAPSVRRLHDLGNNGVWSVFFPMAFGPLSNIIVLAAVPLLMMLSRIVPIRGAGGLLAVLLYLPILVGFGLFIRLLIGKGDTGENRYGEAPLIS